MATSTTVRSHQDRVAIGAIFLIPLIWGIGFPLTHNAVAHIHPGLYAFCRSLVATVSLLPFALPAVRNANLRTLGGGVLIGLFSAVNILSQSYALSYISSASTAFCVTLSAIFIPFVMLAMRQGRLSTLDITSVAIGVIGAYIVLGPDLSGFSVGYLWGMAAAFAIAMNISLVGSLTSGRDDVDRLALSFVQVSFGTLALGYYPATQDLAPVLRTEVWIAILFMGVLSTALAVYLQTKFQARVGSTRTSLIFNLDLVFASLFGLLNHESLTAAQAVGGAVIFLASMLEGAQQLALKLYRRVALSST